MSENLFKKIGKVNESFKRQAWLTKPIYYLLDRWAPTETREDLHWDDEADLAILEQTPLKAKVLLYGVASALAVLVVWAYFAKVDEVTRGEGRVIPSKQVQIIQSLDGGIVSEILVTEGQTVVVGTPLIRIDETRAASSLRENQTQYLALLAKQSRLMALAEGSAFNPPKEVQLEAPQTYDQEYALYISSKEELQSTISIARDQMVQREKELIEVQFRKEVAEKNYESATKELQANKPLLASGAVSEIDILKLERESTKARGDIDQARAQISRIQSSIGEARRKVTEIEQTFKSKVRTELNDITARLNSISETSVGLTDKVKQATLKSPVNGKVSRLFYNTVGGVIQPGKEVLEVVPTDEALILETKIQIKDIAFVRLEQPAIVKLTAYDYSIYGALDAVVEGVSANSIVDEKGNAYYVVRVRTLKSSLGTGLPIIPGMVAQVDIMTGKKTVLSYLLKPVLKAKSYAFSER
ncbi:HlyD family type I secretion periplasmic adaptor subunit [Methylotenera sp.]|uniref:HlyD family type I secretion periplasmic adaptor subunit n=2 Tax=Methylotenera sp. TaxID=2051956 RepID=UPI0027313F38|nr:HlyD family type I secretion periplasmic adaptor subunit [Methylotenera sp.]MDP2070403.1 HlyD family type I secretion periplasmic adaptor subunit [Methylotenera sp.]MDP3006575.1 HlyD family type I secretion periplasmic adaptor subunit [Methylotenera sp.]